MLYEVITLFHFNSDAEPTASSNTAASATDEKYSVLIDLDFDSEEDKSWIMGYSYNFV